jgi:uncharacterized protein YukE
VTWRPSDWEPLAGADPVPGDPGKVRELARHLRDVAHTIEQQSEKLRTMCSSDYWDADAAKKFDHTAQDRAKELSKVYDRYHAASKALDEYVPTLEEEQARSLTYRTEAQALEDDRRAAQARLDSDAAQPADAPERDGHSNDASTVSDFHSHLKTLQDKLAESVRRVHDAARTAAGHLDDTIHHDGLKDGWSDHLKQWVHEHADVIKWIAHWAGIIATVCGVLALCVGWIPIIGQALAAVLTAVAVTMTLVSLVCHLALLWSGDGGVLDVVLDVVGLATLGIGRAVTGSLRAGIAGLKATGKMATAAEQVLPKIAVKGGAVGDDVLGALTHGSLSEAARLSGISRSTLRGMMGNEIGPLTRFGPGGVKSMLGIMEHGPGRFLLRGSDVVDGLRPSTFTNVYKNAWQGGKTLWHDSPQAWGNIRSGAGHLAHDPAGALRGLSDGVRQHISLAPEVSADLRNAQHLVHGLDNAAVHRMQDIVRAQHLVNIGQITTFTGIDLGNTLGAFGSVPDVGRDGLGTWHAR